MVKNPPAYAGDIRDVGSIPGLGISPGEGNGNPPQHSCLKNPMDRGDWWATVHRVVKNLPANAGDAKDMDLIPGSGRSPGGGTDNPLQYSCLE